MADDCCVAESNIGAFTQVLCIVQYSGTLVLYLHYTQCIGKYSTYCHYIYLTAIVT